MADQPLTPLDPVPPERPVDAGSQALSEALRSSFAIVKFLMLVLAVIFVFSGVFKVGPDERAIKLRLGKAVGQGKDALLGPGLHWSLPYPFEEVVKVSVSGVQQVRSTVGWYAVTPAEEAAGTEPPPGGTLNPATDGYALTSDNNIVHTRATVTYRIEDPIRYVFGMINASNAVQNALDNALLYASAHFNVDDMLTRDVFSYREAVRRRLNELVTQQNLGVVIEQCSPDTKAPRQVKQAFDDVLKAEVNRGKALASANGYASQLTNRASADAISRIDVAKSDRARLINDISSRAAQFENLLPRCNENPQLFVQQRLSDTLSRVLTNLQEKIFLPESLDGKDREVRLLLNREPPKLKTEETK